MNEGHNYVGSKTVFMTQNMSGISETIVHLRQNMSGISETIVHLRPYS